MKILCLLLAYTILHLPALSQKEEYPGKEEGLYYKSLKRSKRFKPVSRKNAKSQQFDHIKIRKDRKKNNKFNINDIYNFTSIEEVHNGTYYQLALFKSDDNVPGVCLRISQKTYFLGFSQNYFFHIKNKQIIPLIKNDSTLQVQAAIVRNVKPEILPDELPKFRLVKDHISLLSG